MFSLGLVKAMVEELIVNFKAALGVIYFEHILAGGGGGGVIETGLFVRGGLLFNLAMTEVSVLYKEPECKVVKVIKLEVM